MRVVDKGNGLLLPPLPAPCCQVLGIPLRRKIFHQICCHFFIKKFVHFRRTVLDQIAVKFSHSEKVFSFVDFDTGSSVVVRNLSVILLRHHCGCGPSSSISREREREEERISEFVLAVNKEGGSEESRRGYIQRTKELSVHEAQSVEEKRKNFSLSATNREIHEAQREGVVM